MTALLLSVGVATAAATSDIEGIWSFNGGEIAVEPEGKGKFVGIVVQPTKFAVCTHPDGQHIWKEMTLQQDGSYLGFHQWYESNEGEGCVVKPDFLGPTAWRVLEEANGSRYLRVCLSAPGAAQPSIPPGSPGGRHTSYGCEHSALTAPLAGSAVGSFKQVVSLPAGKKCVSARKFAIHIHDSKYDPFKSVVVTLKGHKVKVVHQRQHYIATITLKGLPAGRLYGQDRRDDRTRQPRIRKPDLSYVREEIQKDEAQETEMTHRSRCRDVPAAPQHR